MILLRGFSFVYGAFLEYNMVNGAFMEHEEEDKNEKFNTGADGTG